MRRADLTPHLPLRAFLRRSAGFTGAEKALMLCFGLAIIVVAGHLVRQGGDRAAGDAQRRLVDNPLVSGRFGLGVAPMQAAALQTVSSSDRPVGELRAPRAMMDEYERRVGFITWGPQKPVTMGGLLGDIEAHLPERYGTTYRDANPITWGHETTHGINSHLRNNLGGGTGRDNGFYVGGDRAVILPEPPITKSSVAPFVPESLRGFRFSQYVTGQTAFEREPLYLLDEWTAYTNGSAVGIELVKSGRWNQPNQDGVAGTLEFTGYAFATAMAVEAQHPGYLAQNPKLKDYIGWNALRAMDLYREGSQMSQFGGFSEQKRIYEALRESPSAQPLRDFIQAQYGEAYLHRLLDGAEPARPSEPPAPQPRPQPQPPAPQQPQPQPPPQPQPRPQPQDPLLADLQGRFELVPDDHTGPRAPNTLTQAEFGQVSRLFTDIREGRTDIRFSASDEKATPGFRDSVMRDFGTLLQTRAGRDLLATMAKNPRANTMTVKMHRDAAGRPDTSNAFADAADPSQRGSWGDGRGVHTVIAYVPGKGVVVPGGDSPWLPLRVDVVLYHEMVHAYHMVHGTMDDSLVRRGPGASDADVNAGIRNSEYQAVGLGPYADAKLTENRYRAERRQLGGRLGEVAGDGTMNRRDEYVVRAGRPAPAPQPQPDPWRPVPQPEPDSPWRPAPQPRRPTPAPPWRPLPPLRPAPQPVPQPLPPWQPPLDPWGRPIPIGQPIPIPIGQPIPIGPPIPIGHPIPGPWIPVGQPIPIGQPIPGPWIPVGQPIPVGPWIPVGAVPGKGARPAALAGRTR